MLRIVILCLLAVGCRNRQSTSETKFIGGTPAPPGVLPATVALPGCTGAKVAENMILTAAHCIVDLGTVQLYSWYEIGKNLIVEHGVNKTQRQKFYLKLTGAYPHSSFMNSLRKYGGKKLKIHLSKAVDLAILEFDRKSLPLSFKKIEIAELDYKSVKSKPQLKLIVGGYGKTSEKTLEQRLEELQKQKKNRLDYLGGGIGTILTSGKSTDPFTLNFAETNLDNLEGTVGKFKSKYIKTKIRKQTVLVFGIGSGDSGGPVYLNDRPANIDLKRHRFKKIIGVNSLSTQHHSVFAVVASAKRYNTENCLKSMLKGERKFINKSKKVKTICDK